MAAKKHRDHKQEEQEAEQAPPAAAPQPAAAAGDDTVTRLTQLKGLLDSGVLTQEEFDAEKAKVLGN